MNDIMSIRGSKIADVKLTKSLNEKKDSFDHLQLTLDDGRKIGFSSTHFTLTRPAHNIFGQDKLELQTYCLVTCSWME